MSIAIAIYSEWADLNLIEEKTIALSERTAPLLQRIARFSVARSEMEGLLTRIQIAYDEREIDQLGEDILSLEASFQSLVNVAENDQLAPLKAGLLSAVIDRQMRIATTNADIRKLNDIALGELETLERRLLAAQGINQVEQGLSDSLAGRQEAYTRSLDRARTLGEMARSLASLTLLTHDVLELRADAIPELAERVIAQIGILVARLARLPDTSVRQDIAESVLAYRSHLLSDNGLLHKIDTIQQLRALQEEQIAVARSLLAREEGWTAEAVQLAAQEFTESAEQTAKVVQRIRLVDMTFNLFLLLMTLGVLWFMIEKRIIHRIDRLKNHIHDISEGILTGPLPLDGCDEITEVEKAVERSRITSRELQLSNEELERFANIAAHDLRAPLRAVTNLVEWTVEDYGPQLPPDARENFQLIQNRVDRMSNHLSALLDYARAGQDDGERGLFSLTEFAAELRKDFVTDPNFGIDVQDTCPAFEAYLTPLKTILINLASNAVKHHDRDQGKVTLSCCCVPDAVQITVADDGPGIAKDYQQKIFVLFQTLKSRDEMEASGLGLALVQKLCTSLGGTVEVHSDPSVERGTKFVVTLPTSLPQIEASFQPYGKAA